MSDATALFREEVLRHRGERLHGDVNVALPTSWQVIGGLLLASIVAALLFLANATYARVENVPGELALDKGLANITPMRRGVVSSIKVIEGQHVREGDELLRVRAEEDLMTGASASDRVNTSLRNQDILLNNQARDIIRAARSEQDRLNEEVKGLSAEIDSLNEQIVGQRELVRSANEEYQEVRVVADKGFISRRDLESRRNVVVERQQQLAQLEQQRMSKRASIAISRRSAAQSAAMAQVQSATTESQRAGLAQQATQADLAKGYTLRSPVNGHVTALVARVGQSLAADAPVMSIVPDMSVQRALLYAPTSAAGFLAVGQDVRIAIDAFPYQQFGTLGGKIESIATAPVTRSVSQNSVNAYLVTVSLEQPWIFAFGRRQPLLPGMSLSARIVTQRRSLIEWLFEPIIAVNNR